MNETKKFESQLNKLLYPGRYSVMCQGCRISISVVNQYLYPCDLCDRRICDLCASKVRVHRPKRCVTCDIIQLKKNKNMHYRLLINRLLTRQWILCQGCKELVHTLAYQPCRRCQRDICEFCFGSDMICKSCILAKKKSKH
jgi:hypothetical protein